MIFVMKIHCRACHKEGFILYNAFIYNTLTQVLKFSFLLPFFFPFWIKMGKFVFPFHHTNPLTMKNPILLLVLLVSFSLVFLSFTKPANNNKVAAAIVLNDSNAVAAPAKVSLSASLYEGLNLAKLGLKREALDYAVQGYEKLLAEGVVEKTQYLTVIDFSQSSRKKRFYLLDMENNKVLVNTFVSHGKNTGVDMAERFSNTMNSEQSSLGFYVTGPTYIGKHGTSLRLKGLEEGFNSNAMARGVVVHGAAYVNAGRVNSGYMGRSQGCPALPENEYAKIIDIIKDGSVMFIYHPSKQYIQQSPVLNN